MSISENKTRMSLVIPKEDKAKVEAIAKEEDRSTNYIICKAIKNYIQEKGGK